MNRKKFFTLISTSFIGIVFLKINPIKIFNNRIEPLNKHSIDIKINPLAVNRDKTGKKNG